MHSAGIGIISWGFYVLSIAWRLRCFVHSMKTTAVCKLWASQRFDDIAFSVRPFLDQEQCIRVFEKRVSSKPIIYLFCTSRLPDSLPDGWLKQPHLAWIRLIGLWGRVRLHTRCAARRQYRHVHSGKTCPWQHGSPSSCAIVTQTIYILSILSTINRSPTSSSCKLVMEEHRYATRCNVVTAFVGCSHGCDHGYVTFIFGLVVFSGHFWLVGTFRLP